MLFKEFGNSENPTVILLHGGGLSWWSMEKIINELQNEYHVVAPIIDGHGENSYETFISIENSAQKLVDYIDKHCGGSVYALAGLSIGAQIVIEVLSKREYIAKYAIIESALVYPIKGITLLTIPMYKLCYGLIRQRWFSRLQAKTLFVPKAMFEKYYEDSIRVSKQSLINITLSNGNYRLKRDISKSKSKVLIIVGGKEISIIKKSAKAIRELINDSKLLILEEMGHGEISLQNPYKYIDLINKFFANQGTNL